MLRRILPEPGDTLANKYKLVRKLGEGGMGVVYEAIHTRIQQRVAIKMLDGRIGTDREHVERFRREARAIARLRHPHIVGVLDSGEHEGIPFMVLEKTTNNVA